MKFFIMGILVAGILFTSVLLVLNRDSEPDVLGTADTNSINVYFSVRPKSVNQFAYTEGVARELDGSNIIDFALQQLLTGPNEDEQEDGFYSAIELSGESDCGGADYEYEFDEETKSLTVDFCRTLVSRQRGDEERALVSINKTLTLLKGIDTVVLK